MFRLPPDSHAAAPAGALLASLPPADRRRVQWVRRAVQNAARYFADEAAARSIVTLAVRADGRFVAIRITRRGAGQGRFRVLWTFGKQSPEPDHAGAAPAPATTGKPAMPTDTKPARVRWLGDDVDGPLHATVNGEVAGTLTRCYLNQ